MIIGCVGYAEHGDGIVAISSPARGIILPGGKWRPTESFQECALRELEQHTGLVGRLPHLLLSAPVGVDDSHTLAFRVRVDDYSTMRGSPEGEVVVATWAMLLKSRYSAYYHLLRSVIGTRLPEDLRAQVARISRLHGGAYEFRGRTLYWGEDMPRGCLDSMVRDKEVAILLTLAGEPHSYVFADARGLVREQLI